MYLPSIRRFTLSLHDALPILGSEIAKVVGEYRGPLFGYASMNFYTEFLAAVDVYHTYDQYFGQLALDKPDRKSTRLNSSHRCISYAVFCLKKKILTLCTMSRS